MKIQKYFSVIFLLLMFSSLFAQKPTEVPKPSEEPIDLSNPADIIIYIVLPICALIFFLLYLRRKNKDKK